MENKITSSSSPKCSIVCLTYNHAAFSREAIQSIAQQDYPNIEVVVVDDGSTDGNVSLIREALEASGRPFTLIAQENTGNIPMNVNRGLAAATGKYISFMSLDDVLYSDCISSKMDYLISDENLIFVSNTCNDEINSCGRPLGVSYRSGLFEKELLSAVDLLEYEFSQLGTFYLQGGVFRRATIDEFGGYDEDISGDDLIFRTKLFRCMIGHPEQRFALLHRPGMAYRKHGNNIHHNVWRQVKTMVEWRNRYFPERPLPNRGVRVVENLFSIYIKAGRSDEIQRVVEFDPLLGELYYAFRSSWKGRRSRIKAFFRKYSRRLF